MATPPERPKKPRPFDPARDTGMRVLLPVGRSGRAIAAGYAGLFSFIFIGAPFPFVFGILAVRAIRRSRSTPHPKHGMGRAVFGIVMGALGVAVFFFAGFSILLG